MPNTATQTAACAKCHGTGFVAAYAHIKNGVCFDCDGTGQVAVLPSPSAVKSRLRWAAARAIGAAVIAGTPVAEATRRDAFDFFEGIGPASWRDVDADARNALGRSPRAGGLMATTTVGPDLVGKVARLQRNPRRTERVRVARVEDLGDGVVVIIGDLLYSSPAYRPDDSRGTFSTLRYGIGDIVQIEGD